MAATVASVSTTTGQSTGTSDITITAPSGVSSGDLLIAFVGQNQTAGTWSLPSGWTQLVADDGAAILAAIVAYKVAGGSEPGSYTFGRDTVLGASEKVGRIFRVTGQHATTWIDYTPTGTVKTTADLSQVTPDETTTEANVLLIRGVIVDRNRMASSTAPSGLTDEDHADSGGTTNAVGLGSGWQTQASSGSTGTKVWTTANNEEAIGYTVGIRSAASGATATPLYYYRMMQS